MGRNRSAVLELAVLGVLHRTPMHGYELRKQITNVLGLFRALSYGSLYPCLHELQAAGLITERRDGNRILYALAGERLALCLGGFLSAVCPEQVVQRRRTARERS